MSGVVEMLVEIYRSFRWLNWSVNVKCTGVGSVTQNQINYFSLQLHF